jgi:hypothetical protein
MRKIHYVILVLVWVNVFMLFLYVMLKNDTRKIEQQIELLKVIDEQPLLDMEEKVELIVE